MDPDRQMHLAMWCVSEARRLRRLERRLPPATPRVVTLAPRIAIPEGHLARQAEKVAPAAASDFVVDWQLRASEIRGE